MECDIQFQIECLTVELASLLMDEYGYSLHQALDRLYSSLTFKKLNDPSTGLYYEGAVYVFSYLKDEMELGHIA